MVNPKKRKEDMVSKIKKFFKYLKWLEDKRMEYAIRSGSFGPLM